MSEDYKEVFDGIRAWQLKGNPGDDKRAPTPYWEGIFYRALMDMKPNPYYVDPTGADPFIDDLKEWFDYIKWIWGLVKTWVLGKYKDPQKWIQEIWDDAIKVAGQIRDLPKTIWDWIVETWQDLVGYIWQFAEDIWLWVKKTWEDIADYIWGLAGIIWDWVKAVWWEIADYIWQTLKVIWGWVKDFWEEILDYVWKLLGSIWLWVKETWTAWEPEAWAWILEKWGPIWAWVLEKWEWIKGYLLEYWERVKAWVLEKRERIEPWIVGKIQEYWPPIRDFLADWLKRIWEGMLAAIGFHSDRYTALATKKYWQAMAWLDEQFIDLMRRAYDEIRDLAMRYRPMTPERSVELAGLMFGSAVGLGAMAHGLALSVEAVPNLKNLGVHYLSAFAARMGGFGAISTATMGVIAAVSLRTPFTYYVNSLLRPTIPDARMLIEFRAKREINLPEFKSYMKYHGYSDRWIELTDSWLWKDPRLFEILYLTDVTVPTEDWLKRKFERAGYEDVDVKYMVRTAQMRTTKSPRTYVMTALRRNYRHGFLTEHELTEGIEALEVAPDAIDWIKRAGELDNIYEINSDLVTAYRTAYRNDLITEEECAASLSALGLPPARVDAVVYLEWVRKTPSAVKAERKELEAEWREVQKEYSQVYIEYFRRGFITEEQLASYLIAIGIKDKVAKMTARHEAIKLLPKTKPEPMPELIVPPPVSPPEYEE